MSSSVKTSDALAANATERLGLHSYQRFTSASIPYTEQFILDPSIVTTPKVPEPWTVDKVLATIPGGKPIEDSDSPIPYFHVLERLKTTKRAGWKRFGINQ